MLIKKFLNKISPYYKYEKGSYSQCGEDVIVFHIFQNIIKNKKPSYIDIGAHHPFNLSNTAFFYNKGCRGINIEPDPILFKSFTKFRKNDINLNLGISDEKGLLDFYTLSDKALNTFSKQDADNYINNERVHLEKIHKIKVENINNIIEQYCNNKFPNFLSLDVEGLDEIILKSIDFQKKNPDVICVETISLNKEGKYYKKASIIDFLASKDYIVYADNFINTVFVKKIYF